MRRSSGVSCHSSGRQLHLFTSNPSLAFSLFYVSFPLLYISHLLPSSFRSSCRYSVHSVGRRMGVGEARRSPTDLWPLSGCLFGGMKGTSPASPHWISHILHFLNDQCSRVWQRGNLSKDPTRIWDRPIHSTFEVDSWLTCSQIQPNNLSTLNVRAVRRLRKQKQSIMLLETSICYYIIVFIINTLVCRTNRIYHLLCYYIH